MQASIQQLPLQLLVIHGQTKRQGASYLLETVAARVRADEQAAQADLFLVNKSPVRVLHAHIAELWLRQKGVATAGCHQQGGNCLGRMKQGFKCYSIQWPIPKKRQLPWDHLAGVTQTNAELTSSGPHGIAVAQQRKPQRPSTSRALGACAIMCQFSEAAYCASDLQVHVLVDGYVVHWPASLQLGAGWLAAPQACPHARHGYHDTCIGVQRCCHQQPI